MGKLLPPQQLGRRIQWLFLLMGLFTVVRSVQPMLAAGVAPPAERGGAIAAAVVLVLWWVRGYRARHLPAWGLPLEAFALSAIGIAQHDYVATLSILFGSVSYRGLFGNWRHVLGFVIAAYCGSVTAVLVTSPSDIGPFLQQSAGVPPLALFIALVALSIRRQEAANARERVFSQVGTTLATTTDPETIYRTAAEAAHRMLGEGPGAWAAVSVPDLDALQRQHVAVLAGDAPAGLVGTAVAIEETADRLAVRLETDKRLYGTLLVHAAPARLREARTSLQALAGQTVLGLVNADHAADLRHQALHDALTGLANRVLLHDHLDRAVARARRGTPLAVLLIDLDGFKQINDTHGHATGDYLLINVAQRLRDAVRGADTVARVGGDEFAVVLDGMESAVDAVDVADRILAAIQAPLTAADGADLTTRASIGLAIFDQHASTDALLHQADTAMYAAKRAGKSRVAYLDPDGEPVLREPVRG
jgi:diguanylate cyclase (GGDEF)-like protein